MAADGKKMKSVQSSIWADCKMCKLVVIVLCLGSLPHISNGQTELENLPSSACYNAQGNAQRCMPVFVNAAFSKTVEATNTCGLTRPIEYCLQTGVTGVRKQCQICDAKRPGYSHPPEFMTDFNNNHNWTWWQSDTMLEGIQYPVVVNLTLNLKKAYDVTYVRLRFHSPRPESFAIYKKTTEDSEWIPYQFYSASCERTYGLEHRGIITSDNEDQPVCTDEYSNISPLTGGSVAFSTLEGRPSAFNFESSPLLQEWVTATAIRISLTRMNTFGDEVFGDARVLKSYFFAISDLSVGARCKCNGHAQECYLGQGPAPDFERREQCRCRHNTDGANCEKCLPMYNDKPWARATETSAYECKRCECNNKADRCYFDEDLYQTTGRGGHCIDCRDNTDGPHCERCKDNHYLKPDDRRCTPCECNPTGSENLQCDAGGRCQCKPGVAGDKCDRCENNYFDFGQAGCRPCGCNPIGSLDNFARCNPVDGTCMCKENVDGRTCDRCKLGYFALREDDPKGCIPCFCYGHSSDCSSAVGYYATSIISDFETGKQRWTAADRANNIIETQYNGVSQSLGVSASGPAQVYFVAPARYLGDQRFSYNQFLTFDLRIGEDDSRPSVIDIIFEGSGQRFSSAIFVQGNDKPSVQTKSFRYRLNERQESQWVPRLNSQAFISILANLTGLKVRATYNNQGVGFIDNIKLDTARPGSNVGDPATWVEQCTCPEGFVGQFCESCAGGYKRDPPNSGSFSSCVPCQCFGHSDSCDPDSGRCICQHNTEGDFCERCISGYYGNPKNGSEFDCKPCPCPDGGPCAQLHNGDVVCTDCKEGHGGNLCDICLDGYHGNPKGGPGIHQDYQACQKCSCNDNIDPNAIRNCDSKTGECLKCIYNTDGFYCEKCLPDYYGDALAMPKGNCTACNCYPPGTQPINGLSCDPKNGQCTCQDHVVGLQCDTCEAGYWNINTGTGCEDCYCDVMGSLSDVCDQVTGQCQCRPGVTGLKCDQCQPNHYGFSNTGCTACNCDPEGSVSLQCDTNGNCPCRTNIEGKHCDRCMENKYNITAGCIECPPCYRLVQTHVNIHRGKLRDLENLIVNIGNNPAAFNDTQFLVYMNQVNDSVVMLLDEARGAISDDGSMGKQLSTLRSSIRDVMIKSNEITNNIRSAESMASNSLVDVDRAKEAIRRAESSLQAAEQYIDTQGREALQKAEDALRQHGVQSKQMTEIANEAKMEAERQRKEAERIEMLAKNALNTSLEAKRLAEETLAMPDEADREIQMLRQKYSEADTLYNQTRALADKARERAKEAYKVALKLYTEATSIQLPVFDLDVLDGNTERIKTSAADIKKEAQRLMQENAKLLNDTINQRSEAEGLLDSGIKNQQKVDELLAEVDVARTLAREAVARAEKTLAEANETLQILLGFNKQVEESKGKAQDAIKKIPDIENLIKRAENKTQEARDALSGAESDANEALSLAQLAQVTATNASMEASRIRQDADSTKVRSTSLKDQADMLFNEMSLTEQELAKYENQATIDSQLAADALGKADGAKNTAKKVSDDVTKALETVTNISTLLGQLVNVDVNKLDDLERELDEAEKELMGTDLQDQYSRLEMANDKILQLVAQYEDDLAYLRKEVDNIQEIKESLPDGCFKNIGIENPGSQ
ncbi:laminin subunit gamma-1 [Magallana gigas]|uniref:laminin subunit gamma-1 n=1 Tax=Magallana gigas TaxID=29159 RepID=UPI003341E263